MGAWRLAGDFEDCWSVVGQEFTDEEGAFVVTAEMAEYVEAYVSYIRETVPEKDLEAEFVEQRYPLFYRPEDGGTADYSCVAKDGTLHVIDLKYGRGVRVDVAGNTQLRIYAASAYMDLIDYYDIKAIQYHIVQPRIVPPVYESESMTPAELMKFVEDVDGVVEKINRGDTIYQASEKACRWCRMKAKCKTNASLQLEACNLDFENLDDPGPAAGDLTEEDLFKIARSAKEVKAWLDSCCDRAYAILESEGPKHGLKLVQGRNMRSWTDDLDMVARVLRNMGLKKSQYTETKMLTVAKTESLIKAERQSNKNLLERQMKRLEPYIEVTQSKPSMVPESDKRQAIDPNAANDDFDVL